jgi:hypothetical protein
MRQDEILELPYEERSFESLLISLEEENQHYIESEKNAKEEEEMENYEEPNLIEEREDYVAAELQDCGLTDEEIFAYQDLPAD